ncbi:sugar phosphate nucleotidyltransferase (plasmid) [Thioclava sp. 'Guangxiensis']|uniref:sugar phosphate nucleotidyltransferase n=1 Tax=Thioclava sp. 'Guangxiensis' TaxID=3149044 RepID=UPI0032C445DC
MTVQDARLPDFPNAHPATFTDCHAVLLAGGRGSRLFELTETLCKPAVPFGTGRIVDYVLSSLVQSGLRRVTVATQYAPEVLERHLQDGWANRFERLSLRFGPTLAQDETGYNGTADAVFRNIAQIDAQSPRDVVILAADHVYQMDFEAMIAAHRASGAAATVAVTPVRREDASEFGIAAVDAQRHVTAFHEKPKVAPVMPDDPSWALASMGIYVFDWAWLRAVLIADAKRPDSRHDFGHDILPEALAQGALSAYALPDLPDGRTAYWRDVGTLDAYRKAQLDLRRGLVPRGLLTSPAAPWSASLRGSKGSIILPGAHVAQDCRLTDCIIGPRASLPAGIVIGEDPEEDARWFRRTDAGTTLVTARMLLRRAEARPRRYPAATVWATSAKAASLPRLLKV